MVAITINTQGHGVGGVINVPHNQPIGPALRTFAQQHWRMGALFSGGAAAPAGPHFSPSHDSTLRVEFDGERVARDFYTTMTPDELDIQDGDELDVRLGEGGPTCYPTPEEVFNTRAGALAYYQVEVRRLRGLAHPAAMQQQQVSALEAQVAQLQQQNMQLQQQNGLQQLQQTRLQSQIEQLGRDKTYLAQKTAQLQQEKDAAASESSRLRQRVATFERLRKSDLEELRDLRREKKAEEQKKAREVQLGKLRSLPSRGSAPGLWPVAPMPIATPVAPSLPMRRSPRVAA